MDFEDETAVSDDLELTSEIDELDTAEKDGVVADAVVDAPEPAPVQRLSTPRSRVSLDEVIACFAPCGRCGYFLVGYRAALGLANLQTAVDRAKSGWIVLTWNDAVRDLVLKSYASVIEENDFHVDGCCPECRRHFIYRASRRPNHPHSLRIEIKPRKRQ